MATAEQELIPFSADRLRGERLLVLAPHPDDEVIGCGGLLRQHAAENRLVRVVVVTDGSAARETSDPAAYRDQRERESRAGLEILGIRDVRFLRLPDRELTGSGGELQREIEAELRAFNPDLILAPSPVEIHPDHAALSRLLVETIQSSPEIAPLLSLTRVAFYEVSQPLRPNTLVDITAEAEKKFEALEAHRSQLEIRNYRAYSEGLNQYRSMSLGQNVRYAEAFRVVDAASIRTTPWTTLKREAAGAGQDVSVLSEPAGISVIVRTKNRHAWLKEAVASIAANEMPAEIVVVNDGGESPSHAISGFNVSLIEHDTSRGRSEAMNAGVRAAKGPFVAFLDDDDLYYPEHLETLARAMGTGTHAAVYTDAVSAFMRMSENGTYQVRDRLRLYARDYDRQLLKFDNYIPLPTILVRKSDFLGLGGFDPAFDLFEDWDFLLRLSSLGDFNRVPRVTCEIRHFEGNASAVLSSPEGSSTFREAKLKVWQKHGVLADPGTIAEVFEKQKRELGRENNRLVDASGRSKHLQLDVDRLERDKKSLLQQLEDAHHERRDTEEHLRVARSAAGALEEELARVRSALHEQQRRAEDAETSTSVYQALAEQRDESLKATFAEIERLNEVLRSIYASKTWKLHELVQSVKGKH